MSSLELNIEGNIIFTVKIVVEMPTLNITLYYDLLRRQIYVIHVSLLTKIVASHKKITFVLLPIKLKIMCNLSRNDKIVGYGKYNLIYIDSALFKVRRYGKIKVQNIIKDNI